MTAVSAHRVTKRFDATLVLEDVSLTVAAGERVALLGPSGSGKTTLLTVLGGAQRPTSGVVSLEPEGCRVSWVIQGNNVLARRTALDNAALESFVDGVGWEAARSRAADALTALGLFKRLEVPGRLLSGGELQRVSLARMLASERPIVFADEPTGQLDAASTALALGAIAAAGLKKTFVIATHDPIVAAFCDRQVEIRNGRVAGNDDGR